MIMILMINLSFSMSFRFASLQTFQINMSGKKQQGQEAVKNYISNTEVKGKENEKIIRNHLLLKKGMMRSVCFNPLLAKPINWVSQIGRTILTT